MRGGGGVEDGAAPQVLGGVGEARHEVEVEVAEHVADGVDLFRIDGDRAFTMLRLVLRGDVSRTCI